jgi:hypothetical protein
VNRTIWLLDVDGVINVTRPGWGAAPESGTAYSAGYPYRLRWAPALTARIRALHATGGVTIRWCSTWCADVAQIERLFGLPSLDRCWADPISSTAAAHAKLATARAVLAQGRRLIWTDDEAVPTCGPVHDELTRTGRGLQPEHLDTIEEFVAADATSDASPDPLQIARRMLGDTFA